MMNYSIRELDAFSVIGQEVELTNYQKRNIQISTQFWRKFNSNLKKSYLSQSGNWVKYAFMERRNGKLYYFCSIPKRTIIPDNFLYKEIPSYKYLVMEHIGAMEKIYETYGKIYKGLIDDGALTVMVGHIAQPAYQKHFNPDFPDKLVPATLSSELLQGLLRGRLGFNGLISTDSTCMLGFTVGMKREMAVPYSIEAGCDMFLFNKDLHEDYQYMMEGYKKGILSEKRLDEAVTRILAAKAAIGLHKKTKEELVPGKEDLRILRNETYENWAKECADKSVTLVKNNENILPLSPAKTKRVLLEILGNYPSSTRVTEHWKALLEKEGFEVSVYEKEDFSSAPDFSVGTFVSKYDLVLYVGNMENASNQVTNRYQWYTFWGNGDNCPWFTAEVPVVYISMANPYSLVDIPQIQTYINCYSNNDYVIDACVEKLMGRSEFKGKSPVDPFCGKEYLKY